MAPNAAHLRSFVLERQYMIVSGTRNGWRFQRLDNGIEFMGLHGYYCQTTVQRTSIIPQLEGTLAYVAETEELYFKTATGWRRMVTVPA